VCIQYEYVNNFTSFLKVFLTHINEMEKRGYVVNKIPTMICYCKVTHINIIRVLFLHQKTLTKQNINKNNFIVKLTLYSIRLESKIVI